jgi:hypothetical protein|tara:strand:- start:106 stop:378 length:273 start_codon:yes stop_codon:yes gene_type:complete
MEKQVVEHNQLIATRVPPGDRWSLVGDPKKEVFNTLTDALEAFLNQTGFKGSYRLDPMDSKLYAIQTNEVEVKKEEPKMFSLYGEFKQGI